MMNQKEYCENLFKRYQELKEKTEVKLFDDLKYPQYNLNENDMKNFKKIKKKTKDCLVFLSENQLMELLEEPDLRNEITKLEK